MTPLLDAILSRETVQLTKLVHERCAAGEAETVRDEILRFSVLAFAPSLHSRAAMYAALAVADLFDDLADRPAVLAAAAGYAAESHVPWGKSPVTNPPALESGYEPEPRRLDEAVEGGDVREGERWLAAVIERNDAAAFFDAAARNAGAEGFGLCTAVAGWRIADRFPPFARFAALRTSLLEWIQSPGSPKGDLDAPFEETVASTVARYLAEGGILRFQGLLVADATLSAERLTGSKGRYADLPGRYRDAGRASGAPGGNLPWSEADLAYRYATDYAVFLQSVPLSARLAELVGLTTCEKIPGVALHDLKTTDGFESWSFA